MYKEKIYLKTHKTLHLATYLSDGLANKKGWFRLVAGCCRIPVECSKAEIGNEEMQLTIAADL